MRHARNAYMPHAAAGCATRVLHKLLLEPDGNAAVACMTSRVTIFRKSQTSEPLRLPIL